MIQEILQLTVLIVLSFCLMCGLAFILNMLLKTAWFPVYLYIIVMIGLLVYWSWGAESVSAAVAGYSLADYLTIASGLFGAVVGGWTIRMLRTKGYTMF